MDQIYEAFLEEQLTEARALAAASDLIDVVPLGSTPQQRFLVRYRCRGLVREPGAEPIEAEKFACGFQMPHDFLHRANPFEVVTWLGPVNFFHPNYSAAGPFGTPILCAGIVLPGTPLCELIERCYEIITYRNVTMSEDDALDFEACQWARANQHRFPIEPRTLRRRTFELALDAVTP
jgi:hypothetical protein